jgi:hypothetical protein
VVCVEDGELAARLLPHLLPHLFSVLQLKHNSGYTSPGRGLHGISLLRSQAGAGLDGQKHSGIPNTRSLKVNSLREDYIDRPCGPMVRVLGYRSRGPTSIPGATRFSE